MCAHTSSLRTIAFLLTASLTAVAAAQTPIGTAFTYQGRLENGASPASGLYDLRFRLFDAASGGAPIGATLCTDNASVIDGLFTVPLDFGAQFAGQQRFLEIEVRADTGLGCADSAGFVVLGPRQPVSAAPNALFSLSASSASNAAQFNGQPPSFYQNASNINSGTLADARLSSNVALLNNAQTFTGAKTFNATTAFNGFVGIGTTTPIGAANFVVSSPAPLFAGMYINATGAASSPFYGYSVNGAIVGFEYVDVLDASKWKLNVNSGVRLTVTGGGDVGIGTASPSNRLTVAQESDNNCFLAINSGSTAAQASGLRLSDRGTAIWTMNKTASNDLVIREVGPNADRLTIAQGGLVAIGFSGVSTDQFAVRTDTLVHAIGGYDNAAAGAGVFGVSTQNDGTGVRGIAPSESGINYGVMGNTFSGAGYGVYSDGRFAATGTKNFQIDHPLDPENKYLNHYCEEGPEPLNIYRGTVTLDENGEATIDLPAYFAEINRDPSYTLTAVGSPMPALYISQKVASNRFSISGGVPNGEVCWRVEAAHNDRFVKTYGAPVEQDKPAESRGKYLQPTLYNQPMEKGQFYRPFPRPRRDQAAN